MLRQFPLSNYVDIYILLGYIIDIAGVSYPYLLTRYNYYTIENSTTVRRRELHAIITNVHNNILLKLTVVVLKYFEFEICDFFLF